MTVTTQAQAMRRFKEIARDSQILTHAIGVMEVDGWFGRGEGKEGLSLCVVPFNVFGNPGETYEDNVCIDGGAVCAGIAIDIAATRYAAARRWNKQRTTTLVNNSLDLFLRLNGHTPSEGLLRGVAGINDHVVKDYDAIKDMFGEALRKLTREKGELLQKFPKAGSWNQLTTV